MEMKLSLFSKVGMFIVGLFLLLIPAIVAAESQKAPQGSPPIEQPLVREGTLALKLAPALGLGKAGSEAEAESLLSEKGILPRNGWIADYPATPDIIGELRKAAANAADAGNIPLGRTEALKRFDAVTAEVAMDIRPQEEDAIVSTGAEGEEAVAPTDINNYYYGVGPPVVTYYTPPEDFFYLYSWVPYPFWCNGFWFGGFFILNDFHRKVFVGRHHHKAFVSNHFRGGNGFTRIDPVARFHGRSNVGIGASGRINPVPVGGHGNMRSNLTATSGQASSSASRMSGRWGSDPRSRGNVGTYAPSSRGVSPTVRNRTYSNGHATSRSYGMPVSQGSQSSPGYVPARGYAIYRRGNSPVRSYSPPVGSYVPARSSGTSSGFTPAGGRTTSSHGGGTSGTSFHGGGGFHGGGMSGSSFRGGGGFSGGFGRR
jgi:hypothetical protein